MKSLIARARCGWGREPRPVGGSRGGPVGKRQGETEKRGRGNDRPKPTVSLMSLEGLFGTSFPLCLCTSTGHNVYYHLLPNSGFGWAGNQGPRPPTAFLMVMMAAAGFYLQQLMTFPNTYSGGAGECGNGIQWQRKCSTRNVIQFCREIACISQYGPV